MSPPTAHLGYAFHHLITSLSGAGDVSDVAGHAIRWQSAEIQKDVAVAGRLVILVLNASRRL